EDYFAIDGAVRHIRTFPLRLRENALCRLDRVDQVINVLVGVVQVETRPGRGDDPEGLQQRLGTMMPRSYGDIVLVQHGGDIVRMDAVNGKRDHTSPGDPRRGSVNRDTRKGRKPLHRHGGERVLVLVDV